MCHRWTNLLACATFKGFCVLHMSNPVGLGKHWRHLGSNVLSENRQKHLKKMFGGAGSAHYLAFVVSCS